MNGEKRHTKHRRTGLAARATCSSPGDGAQSSLPIRRIYVLIFFLNLTQFFLGAISRTKTRQCTTWLERWAYDAGELIRAFDCT